MDAEGGTLEDVPEPVRHLVALVLGDDGRTTPSLDRLLQLHELPRYDNSFDDVVRSTQQAWRQAVKAGDLPLDADSHFSAPVKRETLQLLDQLGQRGNLPITPTRDYYDWAAVHEHYPLEAFRRLEALAEAWNQGIRFGRVAVLGCALLIPPEKSITSLIKTGMLQADTLPPSGSLLTAVGSIGWLLRHGPFPDEMRQLPIDLISSPFRRGKEDTGHEYSVWPDTGDSVQAWWQCGLPRTAWWQYGERLVQVDEEEDFPDYPDSPARWHWPTGPIGNVLAVSNGWQCPRQALLTWTELVKAHPRFRSSVIETISGAPGYSYSVSMRLREFAGFLWTVHNYVLKPYVGWP